MTQGRGANAVAGIRQAEVQHDTDPVQSDRAVEDPIELLRSWLPSNDDPDRPQITLTTVDPDGFPNARTVLLTEFDDEGFYFHTDVQSRKVRDIAANPRVGLVVLWPGFTRQLVVQGLAEVAPIDETAQAYRRRSPYLQQLAWQNTDDFAQLPLEERRERWQRFRVEHTRFPQPANWVGFRVLPLRLLFWVSNPDAASRRVEYVRPSVTQPGGWTRSYLAG